MILKLIFKKTISFLKSVQGEINFFKKILKDVFSV